MAPALIHPVGIPLTPTHDSNDVKTRRRSSTFTAITNWALAVQPGTPAPLSPVKRRRPSFHRRVASSSSSPSFLLTPTTAKSGNVDLTAWGYTSVFLHLPVTPQTPAAFYPPEPVVKSSGKVEKGLKKISSMGILRRNRAKSVTGDSTSPIAATSPVTNTPPTRPRPRSRSRSGSVSTAKPSLKRPGHVKSKSVSATVPNQTKAKKTKTKTKTHPPLPPALQNELMLMQFAGGGSLEANAHKFLEERSKRDGTTKAIDAVYRDENGVMWLDEDERVEYQALIPTEGLSSPPASPWVQFTSSGAVPPVCPTMGAIVMTDEDATRRPSVVSLSPTERELEGGAAAVV
ncbi:hypothetical protein E1B28_007862 [Marasmius oreades]|uniref:Uncharacterized protein n=1 Tax=Marasmius oreades TaxID=181124 RepID=A0A9P7S4B3_9AGAR|nr:uncharacterized protein E1B28_007862 [Marasmius oreades]KAG7094258.1 hypothetical protein E1B28_007862 [Marasmius oreades]